MPSTEQWTVGILAGAATAVGAIIIWRSSRRGHVGPPKLLNLKERMVKYPMRLLEKEKLTRNTRRFRFRFADDVIIGCPVGQHVYLSARVHGELCVRPYTPVSPEGAKGYVDFIIKVYHKTDPDFPNGGKLSQHLDSLEEGTTIDVRGPGGLVVSHGHGQLSVRADKYTAASRLGGIRHIGMVAGGSGITPMLQLIRQVLSDPADKTRLSLVFANCSVADIILRDELDEQQVFANQHREEGQFLVWYTVDTVEPDAGVWRYDVGYVTAAMLCTHLPPPAADTLTFVCGPVAMVAAVKPLLATAGHAADRIVYC